MTDERAFDAMKNNDTVYFVNCVAFQYFVDVGKIVGYSVAYNEAIMYSVESEITGSVEELHAFSLHENSGGAEAERKESQQKHGRVVISQKEYDEYMELKAKYGG